MYCIALLWFFFLFPAGAWAQRGAGIDGDSLQKSKQAVQDALQKIEEFMVSYQEFQKPEEIKSEFTDLITSVQELVSILSEDSDFIKNLRDFKVMYDTYRKDEENLAKDAEDPLKKRKHENLAKKNREGAERVSRKIEEARSVRKQLMAKSIEMQSAEQEILQNIRYLRMKEMEDQIGTTFNSIRSALNEMDDLIENYGEETTGGMPQ